MDYTTLPRQLIYRTRYSLEEFTDNNELNTSLVDEMLNIHFLNSLNFKERVTACFNAAYYICTLILVDEHPEWSIPKYCDLAYCGKANDTENQAISLSLVKIYLKDFDEEWHTTHQKMIRKLDEFFSRQYIFSDNPFEDNISYTQIHDILYSFPVSLYSISPNDFALRVITQETIDELHIAQFSWTHFTDYYKQNIIRDIVFHVGRTEDEMNLLLQSLRYAAEQFYIASNPYYKNLCILFDEIEQDIYFHFHAEENEEFMQAEIEELQYQGDIRPYKTRIAELEAQINNSQQNDNSEYIESLNRQLADEKGKNAKLEEEISKLKEVKKNDKASEDDEKWIDWLDEAVFHPSVNACEVFKTYHKTPSSNLTDKARTFVLYKVLGNIHWLKRNMHQKDIIKWTYAHSGIKWTDSEKLKFTDLAKGILNSDISKWRKSSQRKGESYANFAEALLTEFVYQESGGIQDKLIYIKEGCKYINYITK